MSKKEVAAKEETAVAKLPETPKGFEGGIDDDDVILPRVKLIQAMSPEMSEGLGLNVGDLVNSLTKEPLSDTFIPIFMTKNFIRFNPRSKDDPNFNPEFGPGDIIWRTTDPADPRVADECRFGDNGEKPVAVMFMNFFCKFEGCSMPIILSFSKTSYKAGKQLLSLCRFSEGDMFSRQYKLTTTMESSDSGTYAVLRVSPAGKVSDADYQKCLQLWKDFSVKKKDIVVDHENEERPY